MLNTAGESAFSCPGMPQGVTCKTPAAVFQSTNGALPVSDSDLPMRGTAAFNSMQDRNPDNAQIPRKAVIGIGEGAYIQGNMKTPLPVRSKAQVMRIWIAPWVDKSDDLHLPSFLYTEVQSRKWNLGEAEFVGNGIAVPHRVIEMAPGQLNALPSPPNANNGGGQAARNNSTSVAADAQQFSDDLNLGD